MKLNANGNPVADLNIDLTKLNRAAQEAFQETCLLMGRSFTESISDPKWDWPTEPSPRDIVDTGTLRASQQLVPISDTENKFVWSVEYALFVLLGYTTTQNNVVPGRDWVADGLTRLDAQKTFALLLKSKL